MAESFNTSLKHVASAYLQLLQAKVARSSVQRDIEENPYYPSLLGLSDTFDRYHIRNEAFQVTAENLSQVDPPFVAFVNMDHVGSDFVLVTKMTDEKVFFLYKNKTPQTLSKRAFLDRYQKIVWVAETDKGSGEADYGRKLALEKKVRLRKIAWIAGAAILLAIAIGAGMHAAYAMAFSSIICLKLMGTTVTVLLLAYETDKSNVFVKNICSTGGQSNCDAVLGSKASTIMGVSWGEIGFFYFGSTTLLLLLPVISFDQKVFWIALANVIAAPYILFSIYYQWRVVKQWCPLCLSVQGILLLELAWSIVNFWASAAAFTPRSFSPVTLLFCILAPVIAWYGIKPVLTKARDADLFTAAYKRLQYNPEIFNSLLQQQAKASDGWEQLGISIGSPEASHTIIKVCYPYCGPCAKTHPLLEELIERRTDVQLKIIFSIRKDEQDRGTIVAKHLLAIAAEGDVAKTRESLNDWYLATEKDYERFAEKYPITTELKQQDAKIKAMAEWCGRAQIKFTPTLFVNGHRLPENYEVSELKHIL